MTNVKALMKNALIALLLLASICGLSASETTRIDVMIAYTPAVKAYYNGEAGTLAHIFSLIEGSNLAYQQSNINLQLYLVHAVEVNYVESSSDGTDLDRITGTSDGYMDEIHGLRNAYGADMVCLLKVGNSGIAWVLQQQSGSSGYAFSVVGATGSGFGVFAHELGHNMGCAHDRQNAGVTGLFNDSYGYRFNGTDAVQYRTIMAYTPQAVGSCAFRILT
jgi:hypothetical protein